MNGYVILNTSNDDIIGEFETLQEAEDYKDMCVLPIFQKDYMIMERDAVNDPRIKTMIVEGIEVGDFAGIMKPKISFDEYVPSDIKSNNIVLAVYLDSNPNAVIPLYRFFKTLDYVVLSNYSKSSTHVNTYVVYVEIGRNNFNKRVMMSFIDVFKKLSNFEVDDISISLPTEEGLIPFSWKAISNYLEIRDKHETAEVNKSATVRKIDDVASEMKAVEDENEEQQ